MARPGAIVALSTYDGGLCWSLSSDGGALPDPALRADEIRAAFAELRAAAERLAAGRAERPARTRTAERTSLRGGRMRRGVRATGRSARALAFEKPPSAALTAEGDHEREAEHHRDLEPGQRPGWPLDASFLL